MRLLRRSVWLALATTASALLPCSGPGIVAADATSPPAQPSAIRLRSGTLTGPEDPAGLPKRLRLAPRDLARGGPALLRFDGPLTPAKRAAVEAEGIRLAG